MQKTTDLNIDGKKYFVTQYPAGKGWLLARKLTPIMGGLIGSLVTKGMEDEVTPDMIVGMVTAITSQVSEDEFIPLTENILSTTEIFADDGKRRKIIFDIDFMGLYGHLVKLLVAVLNFQYANFFDVLAERGEARQEQGGRPSPNKIKARG